MAAAAAGAKPPLPNPDSDAKDRVFTPSPGSKFGCEMCRRLGIKRCGGCRMAWYCSRECARLHWTTGDHRTDCKRLRQYDAVVHGDREMALGHTFEAWFESERRIKRGHKNSGALSIEYHRGDAERLVRRLSSVYPDFDFNRQSSTGSHPLAYIAASEFVPWRCEAFMAILSAPGVNVLRPFASGSRKTAIEAVVEVLGVEDEDDRIAASLMDVTPPALLTGIPINCFRVGTHTNTDPHRCSILSALLRRYVMSGDGHETLNSLVRAFGVDSNGMDLARVCNRCNFNATAPSNLRVMWPEQRDRLVATLETLKQLKASLQRYHSELPVVVCSFFDPVFLGASTSLCAITTSYLFS